MSAYCISAWKVSETKGEKNGYIGLVENFWASNNKRKIEKREKKSFVAVQVILLIIFLRKIRKFHFICKRSCKRILIPSSSSKSFESFQALVA